MMEITYEINHNLVRGLDYYSRTVFEISNRDDEPEASALAGGGRYDYLARRLGSKRDTPAVVAPSAWPRAPFHWRRHALTPDS